MTKSYSAQFFGKLHDRMAEDLYLAGMSERTHAGYPRAVRQLADYCKTPPANKQKVGGRNGIGSRRVLSYSRTSPVTGRRHYFYDFKNRVISRSRSHPGSVASVVPKFERDTVDRFRSPNLLWYPVARRRQDNVWDRHHPHRESTRIASAGESTLRSPIPVPAG